MLQVVLCWLRRWFGNVCGLWRKSRRWQLQKQSAGLGRCVQGLCLGRVLGRGLCFAQLCWASTIGRAMRHDDSASQAKPGLARLG